MDFIPISMPSITQKEIDYVTDAVKSGWVSSIGPYVEKFEEEFAGFCGTRYAVATSNGTTALHLALVSLGIKEGSEVVVPDLTFIATANAVSYTGAEVVCVDIEEDILCLDPAKFEKAITSKTKAVVPVHLYGHPANMYEINRIAKKYDLKVVEDAAEAHGAEIEGQKVGSFGDCAIFSFYGNKIITSGEGGMITTDDEKLYNEIKYLRDHAMSNKKRYWHGKIGFNYRITNLQAALGLSQLERIDELIEKKKNIYKWYSNELKGIKNFKINCQREKYKNVFWMICVEILGCDEERRSIIIEGLRKYNIDTRPFFYPVSDMDMYSSSLTNVAHRVSKRGLNLPSYFSITEEQVKYVCRMLKKVVGEVF
ncbi:MAG: DegT/DnrJ/EryC1/StrS family aminotransferase [Nanoarchaeota archaeon]|nr:DegT/DnrJ/EryC1/StrS family aminotransferase [Nanoarchaeota archaeon]